MTSRRAFLKSLLPLAGGLLAACRPAGAPPPVEPTGAAPHGLATTALSPSTPDAVPTPVPPVAGRITPISDLYRQTYVSPVPVLQAEDWRLTIEDAASDGLELSFADLQALPSIEQMHTLECIGNPVGGRLIGNVIWRGASLRDLLARAAAASAHYLVMSADDDYYTSVPLELALDERSLLAYEANGEPLPPAHGFPVRVLLPGVYGQKQPKWVTSLRFSDVYAEGVWEKQGWSDEATIRVNSRIEYPSQGLVWPANEAALITGVAFAGLAGVAQVEVSTNAGQSWHAADLLPGPSPLVWTAWQWAWDAPPAGRHTLQARATDGAGTMQTPAEGLLRGVFPDGTSGIQSVVIEVG
jgi:DMSO/TMAO reductase YedYZ molybdopterin-dependent catalytic subunit